MRADVTICIPAWESEAIISRTLDSVRQQTYENIEVVVSVDLSSDRTVDVCLEHSSADNRIKVVQQPERLGWARNVNYLLDQVQTTYFCLHFHDDLMDRTYIERLRHALEDKPDAVSAHSDIELFGAVNEILPQYDYVGTAAERLAMFLVVPHKGGPLRSLTRRAAVKNLRIPAVDQTSFYSHQAYLLGLITAGPALHVSDALYKQWTRRERGLQDGWRHLTIEHMVRAHRKNAELALHLIDGIANGHEKKVLQFCLYLYMMQTIRVQEAQAGAEELTPPGEISATFDKITLPRRLADFGEEFRGFAMKKYADLKYREGQFAFKKSDFQQAEEQLLITVALNTEEARAWDLLGKTLRLQGKDQQAEAIWHKVRSIKALKD